MNQEPNENDVCECGHRRKRHNLADNCMIIIGNRFCPCQQFKPKKKSGDEECRMTSVSSPALKSPAGESKGDDFISLLEEFGFDYKNTESSARIVAKRSFEKIQALTAQLALVQKHLAEKDRYEKALKKIAGIYIEDTIVAYTARGLAKEALNPTLTKKD